MQGKSRIIRLDAANDRTVRFLSGLHVQLADGAKTSWVTVTRTGSFRDPRYGEFAITRELLLSMVANFEAKTYGQDIFVDVGHKPNDGAAAKILKLAVEGDRLRALVEWTPFGIDAVKNKGYAYLSAEYHENFRDNESGNAHGCVLLGAGLVTRPCIKRLDPVQLNEADADPEGAAILLHPTLLSELLSEVKTTMDKHLKQLEDHLRARKLSEAAITAVLSAARQAMTGMTDDAAMKSLCDALADGVKALGEGSAAPVIHITPGSITAADVQRILAEQRSADDQAAKQLAETRAAHAKTLAETITAATGLDAELKAKLLADASELITPEMTAEQVKRLAENQVNLANQIATARQLSAVGYRFAGNAHITVDDSNSIRALQEAVDKRLRLKLPKDSPNQELVDGVLALYDQANAAQLHREHKMLAGGDGLISDVSVPAAFERTVIREALYPLVALQFVNSGTALFGTSLAIPYSYRDTVAAGRDSVRRYEGQGVARAGIKQAMEMAFPVPQKLAFEVSDEMRYLTANGVLDFEATAENVRNAARIIGEDTERLILNEMVLAGDEFSVAASSDTLTSQVNGTNKVFVLSAFPVVRPRKVFDLQGGQVGSTTNPIVVTLNSVVRAEYDGSNTQASGTYYTMDYNLGELRFVSELGAVVTPTNGWALTVSYSYSTNAFKFDTDLGSLTAGAKWDDFLYRYGLRRTVLEDQRYYRADFGLMSGAVHEQILLANQFKESDNRGQTTVSSAGDLGSVRNVQNYKSFAPGLMLADTRVLIGSRGNTRYRMAKPWTMGQLQDQHDANGRFTGKKEAFGDQFVFLHTPTQLKGCYTSVVLYSATGRVARAS